MVESDEDAVLIISEQHLYKDRLMKFEQIRYFLMNLVEMAAIEVLPLFDIIQKRVERKTCLLKNWRVIKHERCT